MAWWRIRVGTLAWYGERADYLIVSGGESGPYAGYLSAGETVLQIAPTPQRTGPPMRVVKLAKP